MLSHSSLALKKVNQRIRIEHVFHVDTDFVKWGLIRTGLSQSFGFGGHNAVLILREYQ